jgi:hypothetical protein
MPQKPSYCQGIWSRERNPLEKDEACSFYFFQRRHPQDTAALRGSKIAGTRHPVVAPSPLAVTGQTHDTFTKEGAR